MLRAHLSPVERLCEARLTKRSTSEVRLGTTVVSNQSDWETKDFSLRHGVRGEKYGWTLRQPAPKGKSRDSVRAPVRADWRVSAALKEQQKSAYV